jgi:hypothetical protein
MAEDVTDLTLAFAKCPHQMPTHPSSATPVDGGSGDANGGKGKRASGLVVSRSNPHHEPAGSPSGGQFAPGDGSGGSGGSGEVSGDKPAGGQADHKVLGSGKNRDMIEAAVRSLPSSIYEKVKDVAFISQPIIPSQKSGGVSVAGRYSPGPPSMIRVADTAGDRKVKGPVGVLYHEVGHAIDDRMGLSSRLASTLIADVDKMKPEEKYLAKYWINHGPRELFSEAFRVAYSTDKKGGFSMGQKRAEKVFAKSIAAIREAIG